MRKVILALALIMVAGSAFSQFEANTIGSGGCFWDNAGKPHFGMFTGLESNLGLISDSTKGYDVVLRTGYFYSRLDPTYQGLSAFTVVKKSVGIWNKADWFVGLGAGTLYQIKDGSDVTDAALKLETGMTIYKNLSVFLGADYIPLPSGKDPLFAYLGFDLSPRVVKAK